MAADWAAIESLYPKAFPEEDLLPLVRDLLQDPEVALSLTAEIDRTPVGHGLFTNCGVAGCSVKASLVGPIAGEPGCQKQGIGSALMRAGLQHLKDAGVDIVCVLGDPAYYSRFGFATETVVEAPYALPAEWHDAWQSQYLGENPVQASGRLIVPRQWQDAALWAP